MNAGVCTGSSSPGEGLEEECGTQYKMPKPTLPDPNTPKSSAARKHARSSGIGFANLARIVAKKWKNLSPELKAPFEEVALKDKERYQREMVVWRANQEKKKDSEAGDGGARNQRDAELQSFEGCGSLRTPDTADSRSLTNQDSVWRPWNKNQTAKPRHELHASQNDSTANSGYEARANTNRLGNESHGFEYPLYPVPVTMPRKPLTMDGRETPAGTCKGEDVGVAGVPYTRRPPWHHDASFFAPAEGAGVYDYGRHAHSRRETYGRYMYAPPLAPYTIMHYAYAGQAHHDIPYYRNEEMFAGPERNKSVRPTNSLPRHVPHPQYGARYHERTPDHSYSQAYDSQANYADVKPKFTAPGQPLLNENRTVVRPYSYSNRPEALNRVQQHEETLQLNAKADDFRSPLRKKGMGLKHEGGKQEEKESFSQAQGPKHEDCSLLESTFENIDSNLDTETVNFLTTLELE